jgi:sporulation protein YlmC with PRC-barrel domain
MVITGYDPSAPVAVDRKKESVVNKPIAATGLAVALAISVGTGAFAAETMIQTDEMRANKLIGSSVYDRENRDVASIKDLILDKSGKIESVVLSYGTTAGVGGKYVAVSFANLKFDHNRLTLDQTKEQLASLPPFHLDDKDTGAGEGAVPPAGGHATPPRQP